jgi:hypothetical protein
LTGQRQFINGPVLDPLAVGHTPLGSWGAKFGQQIEDRCLARNMGSGERVDLSAFDLQVNAIDGDKAFELFDEFSGCPYELLANVGGSVSFISNQQVISNYGHFTFEAFCSAIVSLVAWLSRGLSSRCLLRV